MLDSTRSDHAFVIAQTNAALMQSWADLARLRASVEQSMFQVTASRIALNASRETLRTETVRPLVGLRGR